MSRFGFTLHRAVCEAVAAFLPVAGSLAVGIGADPMLLAIPTALAANCAFMLPVGGVAERAGVRHRRAHHPADGVGINRGPDQDRE